MKERRQASRKATEIHRNYGRTDRAYKITPVRWVKAPKKTWWQKLINKVKSLAGKTA
jgi:hypothetical protein